MTTWGMAEKQSLYVQTLGPNSMQSNLAMLSMHDRVRLAKQEWDNQSLIRVGHRGRARQSFKMG